MSRSTFCDICGEEMEWPYELYVIWRISANLCPTSESLDVCKSCWKKITKAVKKMRSKEED